MARCLINSSLFLVLFWSVKVFGSADSIVVSVAEIPLLAEADGRGAYITFLEELDVRFKEGEFDIQVYPFARSLKNIMDERADFHIPMIRSPYKSYESEPYLLSDASTGIVCFVIYSHVDAPVFREQLKGNLTQALNIDTIRGIQEMIKFPFPVHEIAQIDHGLSRVINGRIDAFVFAQEETDFRLDALADSAYIHRAPLDCFDEVLVLPKNKRGYELNEKLSLLLAELKQEGTLDELRRDLHTDYKDWQPGASVTTHK